MKRIFYSVNHGVDMSHRHIVVKLFNKLHNAKEYITSLNPEDYNVTIWQIWRHEDMGRGFATDNTTVRLLIDNYVIKTKYHGKL